MHHHHIHPYYYHCPLHSLFQGQLNEVSVVAREQEDEVRVAGLSLLNGGVEGHLWVQRPKIPIKIARARG